MKKVTEEEGEGKETEEENESEGRETAKMNEERRDGKGKYE